MNRPLGPSLLALWTAVSALLALPTAALHACSFFVCARDGEVFAGNNEDYTNPYTKMWFEPGEGADYGRVYFGFLDGFPQGGMNEAGLFFDGASLPRREVPAIEGREDYGEGNIVEEVMRRCATVAEAIEVFQRYQGNFLERAQLQFADATGDAMIVEGERILRKEGDFQVTTNFRQAELAEGDPCPCIRYETIERLLAEGGTPGVEQFTRILNTVHQEGSSPTMYSNIYDLKRQRITLFHFHNYLEPVTLDLAEELEKGAHEVLLHELFPKTFAYRAYEYHYSRREDGR